MISGNTGQCELTPERRRKFSSVTTIPDTISIRARNPILLFDLIIFLLKNQPDHSNSRINIIIYWDNSVFKVIKKFSRIKIVS